MNQTRKDVLNGWKEIAAYLGRDPRTVERWEKQRSLPVRRLPGSGRATVYALVAELDEWLAKPLARDASPSVAEPWTDTPAASSPVPGEAAGWSRIGVGEKASEQAAGRNRRVRRPRWGWALPIAVLVLICFLSYAVATGWKARGNAPVNGKAEPIPIRRLVPSSPVSGVEELYLRGSYQTELRTPESLRRAQEAFTAAIARDPRYAPAYAGLANTFLLLREYAMLPDAEAYPKAMAAAAKALALDPDLPQAHAALGFSEFFWRWNGVASEREFKRALALDPDLPLAHHWYGSVLTHEGRFREGAVELGVAQRLDPSSEAILTSRALALGLSGRRPEAFDLLQEATGEDVAGQDRNPVTMHQVLGTLSLIPPKNIPRFLSEASLAAELKQDAGAAAAMQLAATVYHAHGEEAMWRALLTQEASRHRQDGPTYSMARYEAELGANEQALDDLADLFSRRDSALIGISIDPLFLGLHREKRFQQLRAAMGLPGIEEAESAGADSATYGAS